MLNDSRPSRSFFFALPSNVQFTDSTGLDWTQPFPRDVSRKPDKRVGYCSCKTRSFVEFVDTDSCSFRFLLFQKQDKVNLTFAISSFLSSFLFLLHAFSLIAFSFTPFCNPYHTDSFPLLAHSSASRSPILSRLSLFLPFALPFPFLFLIVFILETIQIPSVMLELQKPGQSAATSEAPGIAARYDSANTTTTRPLHESNS